MSETFDVYHKWLGIPRKDQPPNHYRLLGIDLFESDPDVVEGAADSRMAHVRTFQAGQNSALSQRILNELSAAKLCLLDPLKRTDYDASLRARMAALQATAAGSAEAKAPPAARQAPAMPRQPTLPMAIPLDAASHEPLNPRQVRAKRAPKPWLMPAAIAGLTVAGVALVGIVWQIAGRNEKAALPAVAHKSKTETTGVSTTALASRSEAPATKLQQSVVPEPPLSVPAPAPAPAVDSQAPPGAESVTETPPEPEPVTVVRRTPPPVLPVDSGLPEEQTFSAPPPAAAATSPPPAAFDSAAPPRALEEDPVVLVRKWGGMARREMRSPDKPIVAVRIDNDAIGDDDLAFLRTLTSLTSLELHGKKLSDKTLEWIEPLVSLTSLTIDRAQITDDGLQHLEGLTQLVTLRLTDAALSDAACKHFRQLAELELLDLSDTQVTGSGLPQLRAARLQTLLLDRTRLSDRTIGALSKLSELRSLSLQGTKVGDKGVARLKQLKSLTKIDLSGTHVSNAGEKHLRQGKSLAIIRNRNAKATSIVARSQPLPGAPAFAMPRANANLPPAVPPPQFAAGLARLGQLGGSLSNFNTARPDLATAMSFHGPEVTDASLAFAREFAALLPNLTGLTLWLCPNVTDEGMQELAQINALKSLTMLRTGITDAGLARLTALSNLTELRLLGLQIKSLAPLAALGQLHTLHLWEMSLPPESLAAIGQWKALRELDMNGLQTEGADLAFLPELGELRRLKLRMPGLGDAVTLQLANLRGLQSLSLSGQITDAGLGNLKSLQQISELELPECVITDQGMRLIAQYSALRQLKVCSPAVTNEGLKRLEPLVYLETLDLANTGVGDAGLRHLKRMSRLKDLNLSGTRLTDAGVKDLLPLASLTRLKLANTAVSDEGMSRLKTLPALQHLVLDGTSVGDRGLAAAAAFPKLISLHVKETQVTPDAINKLRQTRQNLNVSR